MNVGDARRNPRASSSWARAAASLLALLTLGALVACGPGLEADDQPGLNIRGENQTAGRDIPTPPRAGRQGSPLKVEIESNGDAPLIIEKVSMDASERIVFEGEDTGTECTFDASVLPSNDGSGNCSAGQVCDEVTNTCLSTELPETPIELPAPQFKEFRFFLTAAETGAVDCPEPGSEVPEKFKENYCGQFSVETNAPQTEGDLINEGDVTFYFQVDAGSGEISVQPQSLTFDNVEPGSSLEKELTIINEASTPLEIDAISVENNTNVLQVGPTTSGSIPGGEQKTWTIYLDVPANMKKEEIPSSDTLFIDSSATNISTAKAVAITINTGSTAGPAIAFDKTALSFKDNKTQTVTISNNGQTKLLINSLTVNGRNGSSVGQDSYSFTYKGKDVPENGNIVDASGIAPGESADLEVTLDGPGNLDPADLVLAHNDPAASGKVPSQNVDSGRSTLLLLAGKDGPVGEIVPQTMNIELTDEVPQDGVQFPFVIYNRGTQPLEVTPDSDPPNFPIPELPADMATTIEAGTLFGATQKFLGKSGDMPEYLTIKMSGNTLGAPLQLNINATPNTDGADPQAVIAPDCSEPLQAEVHKVTALDAGDSSVSSNGMPFYRWYVLDRPDGSRYFVENSGPNAKQFAFRADTAGTYEVALVIEEGSFSEVTTCTIEATAPSAEN